MLDLAPRAGHLYSTDNDLVFGADQTSNIYLSDLYRLDSNESGVRIYINGVTVDSSEDHLPLLPSGSVSAASTAATTSAAAASVSSIVTALIKSTGDKTHTGDSTDFSTATTTTTSAITTSSASVVAASVLSRGKDTTASVAGGGHGDHSGVGYHKEAKGHHRAPSESSPKNFWNHVKSTMASLGSKR